MAGKQFKTSLVISGDSRGAVTAVRATHDELGKLARQQSRTEVGTRSYGSSVAAVAREHAGLASEIDAGTGSLRTWSGVAAGAGVAAATAIAVAQARSAKETQVMADALGMSAGQMSEFAYAAKEQGLEASQSMDLLKDVAEKVGEALRFDSGEGKEALDELGLSAAELVKKSPVDMLMDISVALEQLDSDAEKSAALEMFGNDLTRLLPLLKDGAIGYRELVQQGRDLNVVLSDADISSMSEMADSFERLGDAVTGQINLHIAPALSAMADGVVENMGAIVNGVELAKYGIAGFATVYIAQSVAARVEDGKAVLARHAARVAELELAKARDASALSAARAAEVSAASEVKSYKLVVESTRAEIAREQVRLRSQISAEGRRQAVNRLAVAREELAAATAALSRVEQHHAAAVAGSSAAQDAAAVSGARHAKAATAAGVASRGLSSVLGLFGGPWGLAVVAGISAITFAMNAQAAQAKATADELQRVTALADAAKAKAAEPASMQANLAAEEQALAELQNKVSETERSMARIRKQLDAGGLPTATVVALSQTYATLQTAVAGADDQIKAHQAEINRLKSGLQAAGVEVVGATGQTNKQAEAVAKLIDQLEDQQRQLSQTARQQLEYKLQQENATEADTARALALHDANEALKQKQAAEKAAADAAQKAEQQAQRQSDQFADRISQYNAEIIALTEGTRAKLAYDLAQQGFNETQIETLMALDDHKAALEAQQAADKEAAKASGEHAKAQAKTAASIAANTVTLTTLTEQAAERIDGAFADAWANIDDGFEGLIDGIQSAFTQMLAEMAHEALTKPILLNVQNGMGNLFGGASGGMSGSADLAGNMAALKFGDAGSAAGAAGAAGAGGVSMAAGAIAAGALVTVAAINAHNKADDERMKKYTAEYRQGVQSTGTVLGDINAKSHSVSELTAELVEMNTDVLSVNYDMLNSLRAIESGIAGVSTGMARQLTQAGGLEDYSGSTSTGILDASHNILVNGFNTGVLDAVGLGIVGDFVGGLIGAVSQGIYSKKKSLQDAGIDFAEQTLGAVIDEGFVSAEAFQRIKTTRSFLGIKKSSSSKNTFDLDDAIQYQLGEVFGNAASVLTDVAGEMNIASRLVDQSVDTYIRSLTIDASELSLKGLKGDELSAEIEAYISSNLDSWASQMLDAADLSGWVEQYQEAGEGVFQTLGRLTAQSRAFQETAARLGLQFDASGLASAELTQSLADLAGGFDQLQSQTAAYYSNYFSEAEQQAHLQQQLTAAFADLNQTLPGSKAEFRSLVESLDLTTESGQQTYIRLMQLQGVFSDYADELEKTAQSAIEAAAAMRAAQNQQISDAVTPYLQSLADWSSAELSRIESDYRERIALAEQQMRIGRELRQYVEQLKISELSPYDPGEKLQLASESFAKLLVAAENGDLDAAGQLQGAAQAYLQNADSYYGRSDPYTAIFTDVTDALDQLGLDIAGGWDDSALQSLNRQMLQEQQRIRNYTAQELNWAARNYEQVASIAELLEILPGNLSSTLAGLIERPAAPPASGGSTGGSTAPSRPSLPAIPAQADSLIKTPRDAAIADWVTTTAGFSVRDWENGLMINYEPLSLGAYTATSLGAGYGRDTWSDWFESVSKHLDTSKLSIPAFAKGGDHTGGIRLVGERGPELEVTGPSRIFNAADTRKILSAQSAPQVIVQTDPALLAEMQRLRSQVERLESEQRRANGKAEQQRSDQQRATESVARAAKPPVGVI